MRIAIVSDIHGNLPALEAVVRDIRRRGVDAVVNLGDSLSGPLLPRETAQYLMEQDWLQLAGNHERQLLTQDPDQWGPSDAFAHAQLTAAEFAWLATLQHRAQFNPEVLLCHGTPRSDITYFLDTLEPAGMRVATRNEVDARLGQVSAELVACGHTHIPRALRASTGQWIVNPGSVGLQAYDDVHPYPHVVETGSPDARYAIVERQADGWSSTLIAVPYAYQAMVQLAHKNQRPDWAHALATGYMP
ncbi:metallophosphoesterase family protein [Rhodoferax sp.]|uniref:metallophosphoesterase family protein n=1 Tax=Rhodoferax sp. TaxID=50421 RepID=UPI00374DC5EA